MLHVAALVDIFITKIKFSIIILWQLVWIGRLLWCPSHVRQAWSQLGYSYRCPSHVGKARSHLGPSYWSSHVRQARSQLGTSGKDGVNWAPPTDVLHTSSKHGVNSTPPTDVLHTSGKHGVNSVPPTDVLHTCRKLSVSEPALQQPLCWGHTIANWPFVVNPAFVKLDQKVLNLIKIY